MFRFLKGKVVEVNTKYYEEKLETLFHDYKTYLADEEADKIFKEELNNDSK